MINFDRPPKSVESVDPISHWSSHKITMERSTIFYGKTMGKSWENGDLYGKIHHAING